MTDCHPSCALNDADTSFMIVATCFVMLQTPAGGLAQAGIIRRKNALSMLMQHAVGLALGSLLWLSVGFTLTFGPGRFIGSLEHAFLDGVDEACCYPLSSATTIPGILFATFQMMFALMAPTIVTGAWAERMDFEAFIAFTALWPFLVYYPLAHCIWGEEGILSTWGVLDFAGGMVIHLTAGVAALVVTLVLQKRMSGPMGHHSLPLAYLGGMLIWGAWFFFNGGSAYEANGQASLAVINTNMSASAGAITSVLLGRKLAGRGYSITDFFNGAFAGLAAVTAGSGFIRPGSAVCVGTMGSLCSFLWIERVKPWLNVDDALDVVALQGVPGIVGTLGVGLFAQKYEGEGLGLLYGGGGALLLKQLVAVAVTIGWTGGMTWLLMLFMRRFVGINVSAECEEKGLDLVQMGEQAYDEALAPLLDLGQGVLTAKLIDAARAGDLDKVKRFVQAGASPGAADYDRRTSCHLAAAHGHLHVLKWLHQAFRADLDLNFQDRYGNTPLSDAIQHDHADVVDWLRARGARVSEESGYRRERTFLQAAADGNVQELRWFLEEKRSDPSQADYDGRTALHIAACEGRLDAIRVLLDAGASVQAIDRWGRTPHASALRCKQLDAARLLASPPPPSSGGAPDRSAQGSELTSLLLLEEGSPPAPPRRPGGAPEGTTKAKEMSVEARALVAAAERGDLEEVEAIVSRGADVNQTDYDGRSCLHLAATAGHLNVVRFLIGRHAELDAFDRFGRTALRDAFEHRRLDVAAALRAAGATVTDPVLGRRLCEAAAAGDLDELRSVEITGGNVQAAGYDGRTALHLAASEGRVEVVKWLLRRRVRAAPRDRFGGTPLDDAQRAGFHEIADLLREAGATVADPALARRLCAAAASGDLAALRAIEAEGGDVACADYDGRTALHLAASEGRLEAVKWLAARVPVGALDRFGGSALEDARREGHTATVAFLSGL